MFDALLEGVKQVEPIEDAREYMYVVVSGLPDAARRHLETLMETTEHEFKPEIFRRWEKEALALGRAEGEAIAILTVLKARGIDVPAVTSERITACTDTSQLTKWLERAANARRADDIFTSSS